ncbi:hypothetical protein UA08_09176 [Talaromyces atroroseus]|uniref:Uncharacterized protein n=1 Tax=Talaromyces atroroseus TaxID=1441469 RepID=A0A1Q5Q732_TALAT|nr:hypothetical protein UA08_09176 [Talaromyces atroroseus]OKL55583.1 hypothetical protein UA08_09176 [Talaromyces atroroseus]
MRNPSRLSVIARDAGIVETKRLSILQQPLGSASHGASDEDVSKAKEILIHQRTQSESWKDPLKQKRRFLRTKGKNESLANPDKWTFSRYERYVALDSHIHTLGPVGVAWAILDLNTTDEVFDVNLKYPCEAKSLYEENDWLEYVTAKGSLEYVTFLASCGTRQSAKDKALSISLEREDMPMIRELLLYHANPNNGLEETYFIPAVIQGNFELVSMFLSAPNPLTAAALNTALIKSVQQGHSHLVSLLISHGAGPTYTRGKAVEAAVLNGSLRDLSSICLKSQNTLTMTALHNAISIACTMQDDDLRDSFVDLLLCAGGDANHSALGDLLLQSVKAGRTTTLSLLIKHGTSPNSRDAEGLKHAVQSLRLDLVEIILHSDVSTRGMRRALESIPDEATENQMRSVAMLLLNKGVTEETRSLCLARAVTKGFDDFALSLVKLGVSLDYDDAACVRHILRKQDLSLLEALLIAPCTPENLAKAIPDAMVINTLSVRRHAMHLILRKGVNGRKLHKVLLTVMGEDSPLGTDYELASILIRYKASVDFVGSGANENVIQIATARSDLRALELLCQAKPASETVSAALPLVFKSYSFVNNSNTYDIMSILLRYEVQQGALNETLVNAVAQYSEARIISLLLENGADPNYKDGKAIESALALQDPTALRLICDSGPLEPHALERLVPQALNPRNYSIDKAGRLLQCCVEYRRILDVVLILEVESMGCRQEVIHLLLELGVGVDFKDAAALCCVVRNNDIETTRVLLSKKPEKKHYPTLLQIASKIRGSKDDRLHMMRLLLSHGGPGVGQDDILLQQVQSSTAAAAAATDVDEFSLINLLLDHGASVDHKNGALIQTAISRSRLPLFDLLMSRNPNRGSLVSGFETARRNATFSSHERLHVFVSLIKAGFGGRGDSEALSLAVIEAVERDPLDLTIPRLLMNHGANVEYNLGHAFQSAVLASSPDLVDLFLHQHPSNKTINRVFGRMISSGTMSLSGGLKVGQLLLENGVQKSLVENALSEVFSAANSTKMGYISKKEVGLFLSHGADVNAKDGTYFVQAALKEDMDLFRMLLINGKPDPLVIIPVLIQAIVPEKALLRYLRVLVENSMSPISVKGSTLFMAVERFPRGGELIRFLLENGVSTLASTTVATINPAFGTEDVNLVVWSLLRENPRVSDEIIVAVLQAESVKGWNSLLFLPKTLVCVINADFGLLDSLFVTAKTRLSATILAAKYRRHKVMRELVNQKADLSSRDYQSRSALFYASRNGDTEMVQILNNAGALPDDGSLHEATRQAHPQIVSLLLSAGHDISFPSLLHSDESGLGRSPLEELCLKATRPNSDEDVTWCTRLRETMQILLYNQQGKDIKKDGGSGDNKSILHLALDNDTNALEVTEALLEFPQVWKFINEPVHQFKDAEGFIYSPTKYVEHFHRGPKNIGKQLMRLLLGKRCQDRYYSSRGYDDQPEHAVGIPEDIVAEINKRKRLECEKQEEMARMDELAAHQRDVRLKDHQLELRMSDERYEQTVKQTQERDAYQQRTFQNKHSLALMHEQALNQQRRNQLEEESKLKLRLLSDETMQQQSFLEVGRAKELQYRSRLLAQERETEEAKIGIQKQMMWDRENVDAKQHGRQIELLDHQDQIHEKQHTRHVSLLDRQDQSVKKRAVEARSVAEAARVANMPSNLLQLEELD